MGGDAYGNPWLVATSEKCKDQLHSEVSRPAALIGCSRSGKTRALIELGNKLRAENVNVIFISYNDWTMYAVRESSSPLESLLARIAFAIAKPEVRAYCPGDTSVSLLHDDGRVSLHDDDGIVRFRTSKTSIEKWLAKNNDSVLIIDELNSCVGPGFKHTDETLSELLQASSGFTF